LIELLNGAVHFFSRVHRSLRLVTPFVNGAVEGTEFAARVDADQTRFSLFEGRLRVFNSQGSLLMVKNQSVIAAANQPPVQVAVVHPRDAVHWTLYYPAVIDFKSDDFACGDDWCAAARQSVGAWRRGDLREAFAALAGVPENISDPSFLLVPGGFAAVGGPCGCGPDRSSAGPVIRSTARRCPGASGGNGGGAEQKGGGAPTDRSGDDPSSRQ
jgi:hypothetical protein